MNRSETPAVVVEVRSAGGAVFKLTGDNETKV